MRISLKLLQNYMESTPRLENLDSEKHSQMMDKIVQVATDAEVLEDWDTLASLLAGTE